MVMVMVIVIQLVAVCGVLGVSGIEIKIGSLRCSMRSETDELGSLLASPHFMARCSASTLTSRAITIHDRDDRSREQQKTERSEKADIESGDEMASSICFCYSYSVTVTMAVRDVEPSTRPRRLTH